MGIIMWRARRPRRASGGGATYQSFLVLIQNMTKFIHVQFGFILLILFSKLAFEKVYIKHWILIKSFSKSERFEFGGPRGPSNFQTQAPSSYAPVLTINKFGQNSQSKINVCPCIRIWTVTVIVVDTGLNCLFVDIRSESGALST